jgi:3-hydroxyacyl-CoA dehydrogenase
MPAPKPTNFAKAIEKLAKSRPGEIAPAAIVRCVEAVCTSSTFAAGDAVEKREFMKLLSSPESAALRHMFFAERAGSKVRACIHCDLWLSLSSESGEFAARCTRYRV